MSDSKIPMSQLSSALLTGQKCKTVTQLLLLQICPTGNTRSKFGVHTVLYNIYFYVVHFIHKEKFAYYAQNAY